MLQHPTGGLIVIVHHRAEQLDSAWVRLPYWETYAHLQRTSVRKGDFIRRGDVIGRVGFFADSGGAPHVHWENCTIPCEDARGKFDKLRDPMKQRVICKSDEPTKEPYVLYPVDC